jgi:hypothetical protein
LLGLLFLTLFLLTALMDHFFDIGAYVSLTAALGQLHLPLTLDKSPALLFIQLIYAMGTADTLLIGRALHIGLGYRHPAGITLIVLTFLQLMIH